MIKSLRFLSISASLLLLTVTAMTQWTGSTWIGESCRAFTLQGGFALLILAGLIALSSVLYRQVNAKIALLIVVNLIVAFQLFDHVRQAVLWTFPWETPPRVAMSLPTGQQRPLRLIQHNVLKYKADHQSLIEMLHREDADIVALEEISVPLFLQIRKDPVLLKKYPSYAGTGRGGQAIFSHWPIQRSKTVMTAYDTYILVVEVKTPLGASDTRPLTILVMHPPHPTSLRLHKNQTGVFNVVASWKSRHQGPLLVIGDLNATPYNLNFQAFLRTMNLQDPQKTLGLAPSWPSMLPEGLRIPIDHVLYTPDLLMTTHRFLPSTGSDHLPVYVELYRRQTKAPVKFRSLLTVTDY
jgi:endonuclease/exonuclease/phosphatase (EEP) superfamily protein YafD